MPRIAYRDKRFTDDTITVIDQANAILHEYERQGFTLTLRQLYYQFVARDILPNTDKSYNRLGNIINDARMAGLVDWNHLIDRTRNLRALTHFEGVADALHRTAGWYHIDFWQRQNVRPEVWIEKDALVGVIEGVCRELDVPYFSCRGYTSQSEMWRAGRRLLDWHRMGYETHIIHLGDHDPSGIDMSRDIFDRLEMFMGGTKFQRIALNMDQIEQYAPPPNPAKQTDSRCAAYIERFGHESWELDALEPKVLTGLIAGAVVALRDEAIYQEDLQREANAKGRLDELARRWPDADKWLAISGADDNVAAKIHDHLRRQASWPVVGVEGIQDALDAIARGE